MLSKEEKKRIKEDEKARIVAREWHQVTGCLWVLGIIVLSVVISLLFKDC